jgi:cytochrome c553
MNYALWLVAGSIAFAANGVALAEETAAKPDLAKAKQTADQICAACHAAEGKNRLRQTPISPDSAAYITAQLEHFKSGVRNNAIMAGGRHTHQAADMHALGIYSRSEAQSGGHQELNGAGPLHLGGKPPPACAGCHRRTAPEFVALSAPGRPACRHALAQPKAFKAGECGMDKGGRRQWPGHGSVAARMSDQERRCNTCQLY